LEAINCAVGDEKIHDSPTSYYYKVCSNNLLFVVSPIDCYCACSFDLFSCEEFVFVFIYSFMYLLVCFIVNMSVLWIWLVFLVFISLILTCRCSANRVARRSVRRTRKRCIIFLACSRHRLIKVCADDVQRFLLWVIFQFIYLFYFFLSFIL
jgi:hypothetical protein